VTKFLLPLILAAGMHAAYAQPKYTVTAICQGSGEGINSTGDVCGGYNLPTGTHAFLYKKGKLTDLGLNKSLSAKFPQDVDDAWGLALNNSDFVVGALKDGPNGGDSFLDSFVYLNGKIVPIANGSNDGGFASQAWAVNNSGWVVGSYDAGGTVTTPAPYPGSATARAFLYRNGITYALGTLGGAETQSQAFGINNGGQIVGSSTTVAGFTAPWYAFLYQNGKMQAIGGTSSNRFVPSAINDNGWIAGTVYAYPAQLVSLNCPPGEVNGAVNLNGTFVSNTGTAVLYVNGKFTTIEPSKVNAVSTIGPGSVSAVSINNSGIVIGYSATGVFVYGNGKLYNLNALVQGNWTITEVGHINDAGQIAATGMVKGSTNGVTYALLISPSNSVQP
jgi:probable HAF family extracellular repeat protein